MRVCRRPHAPRGLAVCASPRWALGPQQLRLLREWHAYHHAVLGVRAFFLYDVDGSLEPAAAWPGVKSFPRPQSAVEKRDGSRESQCTWRQV